MDLMDGWKKGHKAKSYDDGCSDGGGSDEVVRPPRVTSIPTNINTKKREKLNGKVVNGHVTVVPRKLRSAIHKRSSHGHEGAISKKGRFKQRSTVSYRLTKDEEEVIETLSSLSCIVTDHGIEGRLLSDENGDQTTNSTMVINEDRNGHVAKIPKIMSIGEESIGASCSMEYLDAEAKSSKHESGNNQNIDVEVNPTVSLVHVQPPSNNRILKHVKLEVATEKSEIVSAIPLHVSSQPRQEIKSSKEFGQITACQEETNSNALNMGNTTSPRGNITEPFPAKTGKVHDSRAGSSENRPSIKKPLPGSDGRRGSWTKCASHVYISHLIRNCQVAEKNSHWPFPNTKSNKLEEKRELHVVAGIKSTDVENFRPELRIEMLQQHNRANLRPDSNHTATSSSIYSPAKPTFDFLSLTGGIKQETPAQLPVLSYLHAMPPSRPHNHPHHNMIPFSLSPGHYSNYSEHLAAQQQQLPHFVSLPFYGPHMNGHVGVGGGGQQQQRQQQIWHAHLTNYRPPPPVIPKWQNSASQSLLACPLPPPPSSTFSGPQQIMAFPFPSSGNLKRQTIHHNLSGSHNDSSQLQVLCSPQRM